MADLDQATQTQLANIQKKTGRSLEELFALVEKSGLEKHGRIRTMLKEELDLGHGDANTVAHFYLRRGDEAPASADDEVTRIYSGPKEDLRSVHDAIMARIDAFGDFEVAPKKAYVSLRRKKQFATVGPATKTQVEVGLNHKNLDAGDRLQALKPGGMCQYRVRLSTTEEVDDELIGWIRSAFDAAG